jgi:hypothetical protein
VHEHVIEKRLLEFADEESRLTQSEFDHLETCSECLAAYAKFILQLARDRAREKTNGNPSTASG